MTFEEFAERAVYVGGAYPPFKGVLIGQFWVSAQGSCTHWCLPRIDSETLNCYGAVEVHVSEKRGNVCPPEDDRFKGAAWAQFFDSSDKFSVAGNMPRADFVAMLNDLEGASL